MFVFFVLVHSYDAAIGALQTAIKEDPGRAQLWINIGVAYASAKKYADADRAFERAVALIDHSPHDFLQRTSCTAPSVQPSQLQQQQQQQQHGDGGGGAMAHALPSATSRGTSSYCDTSRSNSMTSFTDSSSLDSPIDPVRLESTTSSLDSSEYTGDCTLSGFCWW